MGQLTRELFFFKKSLSERKQNCMVVRHDVTKLHEGFIKTPVFNQLVHVGMCIQVHYIQECKTIFNKYIFHLILSGGNAD